MNEGDSQSNRPGVDVMGIIDRLKGKDSCTLQQRAPGMINDLMKQVYQPSLLTTAMAELSNFENNSNIKTRALVDTGSTQTFISSDLVA